jgi:hypothetical protein
MQEAFEKATFELKVGELSEVVETDSGAHIILRTGWSLKRKFMACAFHTGGVPVVLLWKWHCRVEASVQGSEEGGGVKRKKLGNGHIQKHWRRFLLSTGLRRVSCTFSMSPWQFSWPLLEY